MAYIKSHSNYVLQKKHQTISDGTIWERDITTIGGINQFAPGQTPIYKSSNFIITVRSDNKTANQYNTSKWQENSSGTIWTMQTISGMPSDSTVQDDTQIVLKQDYYDLRDFAYYGSLSEMMRASVTDIISRFPGELYITDKEAYYTSAITEDFERIEQRLLLGVAPTATPYTITNESWKYDSTLETEEQDTDLRYVDNPFSIDVHSIKKPQDAEELKFFADGGYKNYQIINGDASSGTPIDNYTSKIIIKRLRYMSEIDADYHSERLYCENIRQKINDIWEKNDGILWSITLDKNKASEDNALYKEILSLNDEFEDEYEKLSKSFWIEEDLGDGHRFLPELYNTERDLKEALKKLTDDENNSGHTYLGVTGSTITPPSKYKLVMQEVCQGYCAAISYINGLKIEAWVGDNEKIVYLSHKDNSGVHIRPLNTYWATFYDDCDTFEKLLINPNTTPKYQATFSVIQENEDGLFQEVQDFTFPTAFGGYNIDASSYGYNDYTTQLSDVGEFYDERFSDNLYRSMTHEAIKNFDWTYTREFNQGDDEEYLEGGEKIQKAIRIFGREFDEILSYIDNIRYANTISYDERNNLPDYFLTDALNGKGWDIKLVYPYNLSEYVIGNNGEKQNIDTADYHEDEQLANKVNDNYLYRVFSQNPNSEIKPYSSAYLPQDIQNGYYIVCEGDKQLCEYEGSIYYVISASADSTTYYDEKRDVLLNRLKPYTSEKKYTYSDVNNAFLRRMIINSNYIWRHKGTTEGIEMLLSMFGLRSKRWTDGFNSSCKTWTPDYEIIEYTSFTPRIQEQWDAVHQMYRIDWINSTKAIVYDYRSTSNYSSYGNNDSYVAYQGLPVLYRDDSSIYIKPSVNGQETTENASEAFKNANNGNEPVKMRYLYPNFDTAEQIDGNIYFQMNGGWLSKTIDNNSKRYNFQFDANDNIAYTNYQDETSQNDNEYLFKETLRTIKRVNTLADLLSTQINSVQEGTIYYVAEVDENTAVINNALYPIKEEYVSGNTYASYISLVKGDEYIEVGDDLFFSDTIAVYDINGKPKIYDLGDKEQGYEVKAYLKLDSELPFICQDSVWTDDDGNYISGSTYGIDSFVLMSAITSADSSNYFMLTDTYSPNRIAIDKSQNGWLRLSVHDPNYIKVNTIVNYYNGNNPHCGNLMYDNGHQYFTYFNKLFKYSIDNDLFDERCYESFYHDLDTEIAKYGFSGLISADESRKYYDNFLIEDDKIHYFGNYYGVSGGTYIYTYNKPYEEDDIFYYNLNTKHMIGENPYIIHSGDTNGDGVTNQIMNNKRMTINFYLHYDWYSQNGQMEIKYLDDIIMNYLTQMIPSTTIVSINYISKRNN